MTKDEYDKIRTGLIDVIENGEAKAVASASAALIELEGVWRKTKLLEELDIDETEEYDEEDGIILAQGGDC